MQKFQIEDFLARSTEKPFEETTLYSVISKLPSCGETGPWLAGGALRRTLLGKEPESDFDYFFRDVDQLKAFREDIVSKGFVKTRETKHHESYTGKVEGSDLPREVQCIKFAYYQNAQEVIDSFDFTICQFAYDGIDVICGEFALWDLGRKRLAVNKITYPVASMRRLLKYANQGFTACNGALTELIRQTAADENLNENLKVHYVD